MAKHATKKAKYASTDKQQPTYVDSALIERKKRLDKKNRTKLIRCIIQVVIIIIAGMLIVYRALFPPQYKPYDATAEGAQTVAGAAYVNAEGEVVMPGFIAISYSGITKFEDLESNIVSQKSFIEQMDALERSGYVTISQQDILDYYLYTGTLPEKALFLMFEDGIRDTTTLVQDTLVEKNYLATINSYAANFDDVGSNFLTVNDLKTLLRSSYWEMGVNGYRLSYINVFDRYDNYYGHLNSDEYVNIVDYLKRDYNHYLMDFLRDEDRLREESLEDMKLRIKEDYEMMQQLYVDNFGFLPPLYVLMHSNTGMFGTDPTVSNENRIYITSLYSMNFNRHGSCWNDLNSSIYDLSRMQPQPYWYTNHLLMRIWDDTGHDVAFVIGDENEAQNWYTDEGVAEYKTNKIVLTSMPYGYGRMTLRNHVFSDVQMDVTLEGNIAGTQTIYLRTDRNHQSGVSVSIENNVFYIRDVGEFSNQELFKMDMFEFDGGSTKSVQEDELEGLVELQKAIINYDEDGDKIAEAQQRLATLSNRNVTTLEEGGKGFVPAIDIADRASRKMTIKLVGSYITVLIDGRVAIENLRVGSTKNGTIMLECSPLIQEEYSQRNLHDDVYDAVFTDMSMSDPRDPTKLYYRYLLNEAQTVGAFFTNTVDKVTQFFVNRF